VIDVANAAAAAFFEGTADVQRLHELTWETEREEAVPRDRWGRPLIIPPGGAGKPKAYSRASGFGKQIENTSSLEKWGKRQMLRAAAIDPTLIDRVPHDVQPDEEKGIEGSFPRTRGGEISKKHRDVLNSLVEQADEVVGSQDKASLGTDIHAATEFIDRGDSLEDKLIAYDPERRALLIDRANAYYKVVKDYGFTFDSIEDFGVQDDVEVAGTWDRRGRVPFWREHSQVILDVKTSGSMDFAGIGFAVQLATYAHSCAYDLHTGTRTPHDDMDLERALIIHVDRNLGGPVELYPVDIETGWRYTGLVNDVIMARRVGDKAIDKNFDERKALVLMCATRRELEEMGDVIRTWPEHLRNFANSYWKGLPA
jgi:hypothetical protein